MEPMSLSPKVGVGVFVIKDGRVLMGQRKGSHGSGDFAGPGGHLEFGETIEECAIREVKEETGIEIENLRVISVANLLYWTDKHYIDFGVIADWKSGDPTVLEPEKCVGWNWYSFDELPSPRFGSVDVYVAAMKSGQVYSGTHRA